MSGILSLIAGIAETRLFSLIKMYMESEVFSSEYGFTLGYIERTFSFCVMYIFYEKLIASKTDVIMLNCAFLYFFIYLYFSEMFVLLQRLPILFAFSYWIVYPHIYGLLSKKGKYFFLFLLVLYGNVLLIQLHKTEASGYENIVVKHRSFSEKEIITDKALYQYANKIKAE
jgi:hypothetical protein